MVKILLIQSLIFVTVFSLNAQSIPDGYYDGTDDLTGTELKSKLHQIIRNHNVRSYSEFRDVILRDLDEDPNNSDNIILFYKNNSIPKSNFASNNQADFWNREHTWPSSHGFSDDSDTAYTDVHNLRPSDATVNTSKSNKDFDDIENTAANAQGEAPDTYTNSDFWEPRDNIKGDVARILLYMDVRYNSSRLDLSVEDRITFSGDPEIGILFTLLRWHNDDPVDDYETARHNKGFTYQNNRNPFIDHPEYVQSIWGDVLKPLLTENLTSFSQDFGTVLFSESKEQSYALRGYNLESDITVSSSSEEFLLSSDGSQYSQSITLSNDLSNSAQDFTIYVQFKPSQANGAVYTADINHTTTNGADLVLSFEGKEGELGIQSILEARTKSLGTEVQVTGVVIDKGNNSSNSRVINDGTAGIVVRSFDSGNESANLSFGDSILVTGTLSEFGNLLQIEESPITIEILKQNAKIPTPRETTISEIGESLESEFVTIKNVIFDDAGSEFAGGGADGNFVIQDGTGSLIFRIGSSDHPIVGTLIRERPYTITGFIGQFFDDYQISVRDVDDLIIEDIAPGSILEARFKEQGEVVKVSGVIIGGENNDQHNRVLFDGTAGIVIRSLEAETATSDLKMGDSITIEGGLLDYFGTLQIAEAPIQITLHSQDNDLPNPQEVSALSEIGEEFESELVFIEKVSVVGVEGDFQGGGNNGLLELNKDGDSGYLLLGSTDHPLVGQTVPDNTFSLTGYVSQLNDQYRISPRSLEDIVIDPLSTNIIEYFNFYPNPTNDVLIFKGGELIEDLNFYNLFGQNIMHFDQVEGEVHISELNGGYYIVSFQMNGSNYVGKIFKN